MEPVVKKITAHDGLLWCESNYIPVPLADRVANFHGFAYAEQLVADLQSKPDGFVTVPATMLPDLSNFI